MKNLRHHLSKTSPQIFTEKTNIKFSRSDWTASLCQLIFISFYCFMATNLMGQPGAGYAIKMDGVNDRVNLGSWGPGTTWTVEAWVKMDALPNNTRGILGGMFDFRPWGLSIRNSGFAGKFKDPSCGNASIYVNSNYMPVVGEWNHVATTKDGSTGKIYVNGELMGTMDVCSTYTASTTRTLIGKEHCCATSYLPGTVDEGRVWTEALSQEEIREHFHLSRTGSEANMKAYYPLNEGSGNAIDHASAGGAQDGTLQGGANWVSSTVPVGNGTSHSATIGGPSKSEFPEQRLILGIPRPTNKFEMTAFLMYGEPEGIQPSGSSNYNPYYWIIEKYGAGNLSNIYLYCYLKIGTGLGQTIDFKLYQRGANADGSWNEVARTTLSSEQFASSGLVTFSDVNCCGQFAVGWTYRNQ